MPNFYPEPSNYQTRKPQMLLFTFVLVSSKTRYRNTNLKITFSADVKKWVHIHTDISGLDSVWISTQNLTQASYKGIDSLFSFPDKHILTLIK